MRSDCIFCKIGTGQIPSRVVYQDEDVFAFEDGNPQAPVHVLVIPKRHIDALSDMRDGDHAVVAHLLEVGVLIAKKKGIAESGYRIVVNNGQDAGQTVFHLHFHMLGGRRMNWPPG